MATENSSVPASMDAEEWADEFLKVVNTIGRDKVDREMMVGWFANAIMRGWDARASQADDAKRVLARVRALPENSGGRWMS